MRVVAFTGSRTWRNTDAIIEVVECLDPMECVLVVGDALGADAIVRDVAQARGFFVACVPVKPHWKRYGKSAGHKRNAAMLALCPSNVWAFWDGVSPGTGGMIRMARERGIPVTILNPAGRIGRL